MLTITATITLGMVGMSSVAAADACAEAPACPYSNVQFDGGWIGTDYSEDLRFFPGTDFNDRTSSIRVNRGRVCCYQHANFRQEVYRLSAGQSNGDLRSVGANDKISSLRPC